MSSSTFNTPSPITVAFDLYVADVRITASDRADTTVEVRPSDPATAADVKAAEGTRVEYDDASRTLAVISRKRLNRLVGVSGKRPESVDIVIHLPADSHVQGEAGMGDLVCDGALGAVAFKTGFGAIRLTETGPLTARSGYGEVAVETVVGAAEAHTGSGEIRIGSVDGPADLSNSNGVVRIGTVTGAATVKSSNGPVSVDRALSDLAASSANGRVRIGEVVRGKVSATSKNGSVEIGVREGSAAWLKLSTSYGRVDNQLDEADEPGADEPVDKVEIHADTRAGDVTVRRAQPLDQEV
jgi:DUF4097 and DUF4098 domain-containing protein YvlB